MFLLMVIRFPPRTTTHTRKGAYSVAPIGLDALIGGSRRASIARLPHRSGTATAIATATTTQVQAARYAHELRNGLYVLIHFSVHCDTLGSHYGPDFLIIRLFLYLPKRGRETKKTIGWVNTHNEFTCSCGAVITLDTSKFKLGIAKGQRRRQGSARRS